MKAGRTGALSGFVIWIFIFGILCSCFFPVALIFGGITSTIQFALRTLGSRLCPAGTNPECFSYATTTTDEYGNSQPGTAYELHCVDTNGVIITRDAIQYAIIWNGVIAIIGLVIAALLALLLALPAGIFITRLFNREEKINTSATIEFE